jgi:hypothetical protein
VTSNNRLGGNTLHLATIRTSAEEVTTHITNATTKMKACRKEAETIGTIEEEAVVVAVSTESLREMIVEAIDAIEVETTTTTDGGTIGAMTTAGIETTAIAAADTSQAIEMMPVVDLTIKIIDA